MSGHVKLHTSILQSSLWFQPVDRDVFITALLLAQPRAFRHEIPQLEPDSLQRTGFVIPPGRYGFCETSGVGLLHLAQVDQAAGMEALRRLGSPEQVSRSPEHEGRRLCRVAGGYVVLNYGKYRDKDTTAAKRMRDWRERQRQEQTESYAVTGRNDTHADADADAEASASVSAVPSSHGPEKLIQPDSVSGARAQSPGASSGNRTQQPGSGSRKGQTKKGTGTSSAPRGRAGAGSAPKGLLPKGWRPTVRSVKLCQELGLELSDETARFRDHARQSGRAAADWHAAFNNWLRDSRRRQAEGSARPSSGGRDRRFPEPQPHTGPPLQVHRMTIE